MVHTWTTGIATNNEGRSYLAKASTRSRGKCSPSMIPGMPTTRPTESRALPDDWPELPHGGGIYVTWAELTDLYDTGKTPIADAHAALRQAATNWLERPDLPTEAFIENWLKETVSVTRSLVDRDGNWWGSPS